MGVITIDGEAAKSFETKQGTSPPPDTARISNSGEGTLSWSLSDDAGWLAVVPASGVLAAGDDVDLAFRVSSESLEAGDHVATVTISSPNASNSPRTIEVSLLVKGPAIGVVGAPTLQFETQEGTDPPPQTKRIGNAGGGTLTWSVEVGETWLDVSPSSGSLDIDQRQDLTITVASSSLAPGSYQGTVTVLSTEASNSPRAITVDLEVKPTEAAVALVVISPPSASIVTGQEVQLFAEAFDAAGNQLEGREVSWSSSDPEVASVNALGVVRGQASSGEATITATIEGVTANARVAVELMILTGIRDIVEFLEQCPTEDPSFEEILDDFEIRMDWSPLATPITCTSPVSAMPTEQFTNELRAAQTLRVAYYMSAGTEGFLPWTQKGLYEWMTSNVSGVNIDTRTGASDRCCAVVDGKRFFTIRLHDLTDPSARTWARFSGSLGLYVHEIRHADGGHPHVNGCDAFPLPTDTHGCDPTYDLDDLGAYGVHYWMLHGWATGLLNIGIGCAEPELAREYVQRHETELNALRRRFVTGAPPVFEAREPYGGPCIP